MGQPFLSTVAARLEALEASSSAAAGQADPDAPGWTASSLAGTLSFVVAVAAVTALALTGTVDGDAALALIAGLLAPSPVALSPNLRRRLSR